MKRNLKAALATAALMVSAPAAPALAAEFTLGLSAPPGPVVGQPTVIEVEGTIPPEYLWFSYYSSAHVIPTTVLPQCPGDHWSAYQVARASGLVLTTLHRLQPDAAGDFAFPLAFTPWSPGDYLVCAYTDDGQTLTIAGTAMAMSVQAAPAGPPPPASGGPAAPANTARPTLRRSGRRLVCGTGSWSNGASGYSYRWLVNGKARDGGRTLRISRRLRGRRVRCSVTVANSAGSATAVSRRLRVA